MEMSLTHPKLNHLMFENLLPKIGIDSKFFSPLSIKLGGGNLFEVSFLSAKFMDSLLHRDLFQPKAKNPREWCRIINKNCNINKFVK